MQKESDTIMTKKGKKEKKVLSLSDFHAQGASKPQPRNALPKGPGEAQPSRYDNRRGGNSRGGRGFNGGGEVERSRADESNQWRRKGGSTGGPPKRNFGGFSGGDRDRDRGDRGGDRRNYGMDRRDRRDNDDSRGDEMFSRAAFGKKKQTGSSFGGDGPRRTSSFRDRDRSGMGGGFGSGSRDNNDDAMDRSKWGQRKIAIKPSMNRGRGPRSSFMDKRGEFDGSGKGFGASLVADCFVPLEQNDDRRITYANNNNKPRMTAWNQPVHQKSEEQIQKEKERREERNRKIEEERKTREEKERKQEAERKKKEEEERTIEKERKRKEAEEKHLKEMRSAVIDMMRSDEDAVQLTLEQCQIVVPELDCNEQEAERVGVGLGMSVHSNVIGMNDAIGLLPEASHDVFLATMFDTLVKRIGESQFLRELDINQVNFDEIVRDPDNFEQLIKRFGLTCLLDSGEDNDKLEPAFAEHINLKDLRVLLGKDAISPGLRQRIFTYICDEFFTNRDISKPAEYFDDVDLFFNITTEEKHVVEFIDVLIESWFKHGKEPMLVDLFDHLIRIDIAPAHLVTQWNMMSEMNMDAKMAALLCENDFRFKVEDEVYDGENFSTWLSQIDEIYPEPEEEDEDDWNENGV